ncbi:MAG TPA: ABC transporter permease [Bacteriovoracaceae bacterium]|nr:ABC transporter permease [Bacteriovoracaceae bacterium]
MKELAEKQVTLIGTNILKNLTGLGDFTNFTFKTIYWTFKPPYRFKLLFDQIYFMGNKSVFIIFLTSSFTGAVFAFQIYLGFKAINADSFIGPIVTIALAKELAPVLSGLVVAGRCGAAMAAQIGSMKVTEQIDALEVMGINGYQYLAVPRILGATISMPMLSAMFLLVGYYGSWLIGVKVLMIDEILYTQKISDFMTLGMVAEGLIKATVFGYLIGVIGTYQGFNVEGGAEGVGKGTNMAVVWGMITVLVVDFFLTSFLAKIL